MSKAWIMSAAIDLDHLELYVCGDAALRDEILTIFTEQAELWSARLDAHLDDDDWRNAAHALKGAARGVGAWTVGELCETAERLTGDVPGKIVSRQSLLSDLAAELALALADARQHRDGA